MFQMRQYIRHPSELPIHYKTNAGRTLRGDNADKMQDISSGGLSFHSDYRIQPGKSVHIEIQVKPPPFVADGEVVWCRKQPDGYLIGLRFDDSDTEYSLRMVEQVCHIEQYRRKILRKEGRRLTSEQAAMEWISQFAADFPK